MVDLGVELELALGHATETAQGAQLQLSDVVGVVLVLDQGVLRPEDRAARRAGLGNEYTLVNISDVYLQESIRLESLGALVAVDIFLLDMRL